MKKIVRIVSCLLAGLLILTLSSCPEAGTGVVTLLGSWVTLEDSPKPEGDLTSQTGIKAGAVTTFNADGTYSCTYQAFVWSVPGTLFNSFHSGTYTVASGSLTSAPTVLSFEVTASSAEASGGAGAPAIGFESEWYVNTLTSTLLYVGTDIDEEANGIADIWMVAVRQ